MMIFVSSANVSQKNTTKMYRRKKNFFTQLSMKKKNSFSFRKLSSSRCRTRTNTREGEWIWTALELFFCSYINVGWCFSRLFRQRLLFLYIADGGWRNRNYSAGSTRLTLAESNSFIRIWMHDGFELVSVRTFATHIYTSEHVCLFWFSFPTR